MKAFDEATAASWGTCRPTSPGARRSARRSRRGRRRAPPPARATAGGAGDGRGAARSRPVRSGLAIWVSWGPVRRIERAVIPGPIADPSTAAVEPRPEPRAEVPLAGDRGSRRLGSRPRTRTARPRRLARTATRVAASPIGGVLSLLALTVVGPRARAPCGPARTGRTAAPRRLHRQRESRAAHAAHQRLPPRRDAGRGGGAACRIAVASWRRW